MPGRGRRAHVAPGEVSGCPLTGRTASRTLPACGASEYLHSLATRSSACDEALRANTCRSTWCPCRTRRSRSARRPCAWRRPVRASSAAFLIQAPSAWVYMRELRRAEVDGRLGARLERIADDDRDLVDHLLGRPRRDEHVGRIARPVRRLGRRRGRLGQREADLLAAGGRRVGAPVAELAEQRRLAAARRGRRLRRFLLGGGFFALLRFPWFLSRAPWLLGRRSVAARPQRSAARTSPRAPAELRDRNARIVIIGPPASAMSAKSPRSHRNTGEIDDVKAIRRDLARFSHQAWPRAVTRQCRRPM